jgi:hypothetical protein
MKRRASFTAYEFFERVAATLGHDERRLAEGR